jgi:hypothetical protein
VLALVSNKTLFDAGTGFLNLIKYQYVWGYFMNNTDQSIAIARNIIFTKSLLKARFSHIIN